MSCNFSNYMQKRSLNCSSFDGTRTHASQILIGRYYQLSYMYEATSWEWCKFLGESSQLTCKGQCVIWFSICRSKEFKFIAQIVIRMHTVVIRLFDEAVQQFKTRNKPSYRCNSAVYSTHLKAPSKAKKSACIISRSRASASNAVVLPRAESLLRLNLHCNQT